MPVYNGGDYLRPAVESILAQTFTDFEFLIIDDGSTDNSSALLNEYTDPRIRLEPNQYNMKLIATLNKGLQLARGQFIARMDCDDIALPARVEKQVAFLHQHPEIGVLGSNYQIIDPTGKPGAISHYPSEHAIIRWRLIFGCFIAHPTVMYRAELIRHLGGYQPGITGEDYELWSRAAWQTRLANLPDVLHQLRKHPASSSSLQADKLRLENGTRSQAVMTRILGQETPLELAAQIRAWQFNSPAEARSAARLIAQLCYANLADASLTPREKRLIRTDAAKWLLHLVRQYRAWPALPLALQLDPLIPLRLPALALRFLSS
jgi:glycosyltransferase involved in cell wall biosynthesis